MFRQQESYLSPYREYARTKGEWRAVKDRFFVGSRVRVKLENPEGNPRTPVYSRGKQGVITGVHGTMESPIDHRGVYPPLYTVEFAVHDLFGGASSDTVWVDVHEEWLEGLGGAPD